MIDLKRLKEANAAKNQDLVQAGAGLSDAYPEFMRLSLTERCNLACVGCTLGASANADLPRAALEHIVSILPFVRGIDIGGGEPMLHPGWEYLLSSCRDCGVSTRLTSSGTLLDPGKNDLLVNSRLDVLRLGVDGARAATHNALRPGGDFDGLIAAVTDLSRRKRAYGSGLPMVELVFTAMRANIEELPELVRLAREIGAEAVSAVSLRAETLTQASQSLYFHQALSDEMMLRAIDEGQKYAIKVTCPPLFSRPWENQASSVVNPCQSPWREIIVAADGTAAVCRGDASPAGSLSDGEFFEAWNHPWRTMVRETANTPRAGNACRVCREGGQAASRIGAHIVNPDVALQALGLHGGKLGNGSRAGFLAA